MAETIVIACKVSEADECNDKEKNRNTKKVNELFLVIRTCWCVHRQCGRLCLVNVTVIKI